MKPYPMTDPIEIIVAEALTIAGIAWERGRHQRLDFYLPDSGVHIEVKQFPTERTFAQLTRPEAADTILIQGRAAAKAFAAMIAPQNPKGGGAKQ